MALYFMLLDTYSKHEDGHHCQKFTVQILDHPLAEVFHETKKLAVPIRQ